MALVEPNNSLAPNPFDRVGAVIETGFLFAIRKRDTHKRFAVDLVHVDIEIRFFILLSFPIFQHFHKI